MKAKRLLLWKVFFSLVFCFGVTLFSWKGHAMPISETSSENEPVSSGSIYGLTDEQRKKLIEKANRGDKDAAFALYQYFSLSNYGETQEEQWLEVAAKNGHTVAQYNLAVRYMEKNDLKQATYWAQKALQNGDKDAANLLDEMKGK